jgi:hypothetical protein
MRPRVAGKAPRRRSGPKERSETVVDIVTRIVTPVGEDRNGHAEMSASPSGSVRYSPSAGLVSVPGAKPQFKSPGAARAARNKSQPRKRS